MVLSENSKVVFHIMGPHNAHLERAIFSFDDERISSDHFIGNSWQEQCWSNKTFTGSELIHICTHTTRKKSCLNKMAFATIQRPSILISRIFAAHLCWLQRRIAVRSIKESIRWQIPNVEVVYIHHIGNLAKACLNFIRFHVQEKWTQPNHQSSIEWINSHNKILQHREIWNLVGLMLYPTNMTTASQTRFAKTYKLFAGCEASKPTSVAATSYIRIFTGKHFRQTKLEGSTACLKSSRSKPILPRSTCHWIHTAKRSNQEYIYMQL